MGSLHARVYAQLRKKEGVELAGVYSRRATRAKELGKIVGAPACTDAGEILDDDSIDAVDVCVPSQHHRRHVVAALERGKHVFCETPMALTLEDADAMLGAARKNRRFLIVAQVMRFVAPYMRAHDEVIAGKLGRPRLIVARRLSRPYWSRKRPRPFRAYGEPLIELSIHDFDVVNWFLGRPVSCLAAGVEGPSGRTEHAFATIAYRNAAALVEGSAMMPRGFPFTTALRVQCEEGVLDMTAQFTAGPIPEERFVRYRVGRRPEAVRVRGHDPYEEECRHFVRCVQGKADAGLLRAESERDALWIALAARESMRTRGSVRL